MYEPSNYNGYYDYDGYLHHAEKENSIEPLPLSLWGFTYEDRLIEAIDEVEKLQTTET